MKTLKTIYAEDLEDIAIGGAPVAVATPMSES